MKKVFKKWFFLICVGVILMVPFISACGKKAPPKPPVKESGGQTPNAHEKK
jgi:hypothetical protein